VFDRTQYNIDAQLHRTWCSHGFNWIHN